MSIPFIFLVLFTIASRNNKNMGINLTKDLQNLHAENKTKHSGEKSKKTCLN